jgi:adenylate cyclase
MSALSFEEKLSLEKLRLEKLRARILIGIFVLGTIVQLAFFLFNVKGILNNPGVRNSFLFTFGFNLFAVIFGISHLTFLNSISKKRKFSLTIYGRIAHTTLEALFPAFLLYFIFASFTYSINELDSLTFYLYFILIILSTLRLNFFLSVWAGFVSAAGYLVLGLFVLKDSGIAESIGAISPPRSMTVINTGVVLLVCGIVTGFISNQVGKSITRMVRAVEEEGKIFNLFSQQTSREVVDEILSSANKAESKLMNVCVMFIDIRNFTSMAGSKPASEILEYQNAFFSTVIDVVYKNKGIINQFLGDGCMVTFGAPQPLDNPSDAAVKSAYELKEAIGLKVREGILPPTTIGIGMHAGEAVTGNIGNEQRQQYSITGSVVILASRIEQLNKEFATQILASKEVINNVVFTGNKPRLLGAFRLKGWDQMVDVYELV